jgi:hypothetical protein
MTRILIHVEGETEETFVNEVLAEHLRSAGYEKVSARLMGNARQRDRRGGIRAWSSVRSDIVRHLTQDRGCLLTTMVDYYGLPKSGPRAWPGREQADAAPFEHKAALVEEALWADLGTELAGEGAAKRFIPYIMMHEFEGMLFSDCSRLASGIGRPDLAASLTAVRQDFGSPEEINDSPHTAPSKRMEALVPGYQKPLHGNIAAIEIGLAAIRRQCPHFSAWLARLEAWIAATAADHRRVAGATQRSERARVKVKRSPKTSSP